MWGITLKNKLIHLLKSYKCNLILVDIFCLLYVVIFIGLSFFTPIHYQRFFSKFVFIHLNGWVIIYIPFLIFIFQVLFVIRYFKLEKLFIIIINFLFITLVSYIIFIYMLEEYIRLYGE